MSRARVLLATFAALLPAFGAAPTAHAAAELTVAPTIIELSGAPGEVLSTPITATAGTQQDVTVRLVHADFGFEDSGYSIVLIRDGAQETTAFSTRGWFSLPRPEYRIRRGRSIQLPLQVRIPKNSPGGTHLGVALLQVVPPPAASGTTQVQAVPEAGPLLFISVKGGDPPKARVKRFDTPRITLRGPVRPRITIANDGDEFYSFQGSLSLRGPGADRTIDIGRQFVVPGQPRRLRVSADATGAAGQLKLGSKQLGFGRYRATLRLRIQPTGTTLVSTRTIWVVPLWTWIVGGLLLAVLVALAIRIRMSLRQRAQAGPPAAEPAAAEPHDEPAIEAPAINELAINELAIDEHGADDEDLLDAADLDWDEDLSEEDEPSEDPDDEPLEESDWDEDSGHPGEVD